MLLFIVILCFVGAMAGTTPPTEAKTAILQSAMVEPAVSLDSAPAKQELSCDVHPIYRDLTLSPGAQATAASIEHCHDE